MMSFTSAQIPCCICGTMIYPNAANQCTTCLSQDFNLQDYIQRPPSSSTGNDLRGDDRRRQQSNHQIIIYQCRNCRRFQRTEKCWEHAEHESSQLMSICLKNIPALQQNYHSSSSSSIMPSSSSSTCTSSSTNNTAAIGPLRLIDAQWIWTEPHCMRYKIRCTIQTEIHQVRVQQRVQVLLHCVFKMCVDCTREFNHRTWQSVVQLRQKGTAEQQLSSSTTSTSATSSTHPTTTMNGLMILEQTLAKHKEIRKHVLKIDPVPHQGGFDFYFITIPHAHTFVSFLQRIIPMRVRTSKKLVSTDAHSKNTAHMKHTMVCDMVPFQVHDLMVIHKSTTKCKLAGHLVLVTKLASVIHLVNAAPGSSRNNSNHNRKNANSATASITSATTNTPSNSLIDDCIMELSAETYYKQEKQYRVLQSSHRLVRFVVLDVELLETSHTDRDNNNSSNNDKSMTPTISLNSFTSTGPKQKQQYAMADVCVARESDMGCNDRTYNAVTHLGLQLEAGDIVLGYDLTSSFMYLDEDDMKDTFYHNFTMPDIVLVKKAPPVTTNTTSDTKSSTTSKSSKKSSRNNNKEKRRQNDGKRARELEVRAKRMGFIEGGEVDEPDDEQILPDDDDTLVQDPNIIEDDNEVHSTTTTTRWNQFATEDDSLLYDTDIVNEVLALEREFETLDLLQQSNDNDDEELNDEVDVDDENLDNNEDETDDTAGDNSLCYK